MKPHLIFDYDGVIADSREAWLYCFRQTIKKMGVHVDISPEKFMQVAGPKTEATLRNALPEKEKHRSAEGKEIIDRIVSTKGVEMVTLCRNAKETLEKLKKAGYRMTLLTNSDAAFVYPALKKLGIGKNLWDLVITADDTFETKEDAIEFIAKAMRTELKNCIYIADREHDIEIARNVGAKIICPSNEFSWADESAIKKAAPDFLIYDLSELPKLLAKI